MKRTLILVTSLLLLIGSVTVIGQRLRKHGGLIDITNSGAVVITPQTGQATTITGPTNVVGATSITGATTITGATGITGATSITGAETVSSTLGVTGVTTATGGLSVGSGNGTLLRLTSGTASLDFTALAANSCETLTIPVTNSTTGSSVSLGIPDALADVDGATESTTFFGWVSANGTVSVRRCNVTGTVTADPPAATVRATVLTF
jgi:hypothetical protein